MGLSAWGRLLIAPVQRPASGALLPSLPWIVWFCFGFTCIVRIGERSQSGSTQSLGGSWVRILGTMFDSVLCPLGSGHSPMAHGGDEVKCRKLGLKPSSPAELQNLEDRPHLTQEEEARLYWSCAPCVHCTEAQRTLHLGGWR